VDAPQPDSPSLLPAWVDQSFIRQTIEVFQPRYSHKLTPEDALDMILNVGHLLDIVVGGGSPQPALERRAA
jgi:hypothetical protein